MTYAYTVTLTSRLIVTSVHESFASALHAMLTDTRDILVSGISTSYAGNYAIVCRLEGK